MILDATTKSIELILGAAVTTNAMPVTVDYVDLTTTTTLAGSSDTQSNGTTAVTIVAAPAASTQRKVNALTVFNADTASKVVTIRLNNNTTLRNLISVTLQIGDTIGYSDTGGWYLLDSNGNLKAVQAASATSIASAIHGATDKATPVGADELGIWDSVTGLLNKVSFTNALSWFAAKLGNSANVFSVAAATASEHAVRLDQIGGAAMQSGTFTATGTGFATPPTATVTYKIMNGMCFINIPQTGISGVSNAVTFTITGMPVAARPSAIRYAPVLLGANNGSTISNAYMQIATDGTMTLGVNGDPNAWTAANNKGLYTTTIAYML